MLVLLLSAKTKLLIAQAKPNYDNLRKAVKTLYLIIYCCESYNKLQLS